MKRYISLLFVLIIFINCNASTPGKIISPYFFTPEYDDLVTPADYDVYISEPEGFRLADTTNFVKDLNLPYGGLMFTLRDSVDGDPDRVILTNRESKYFISPNNDYLLVHPSLDFTYIGSAKGFANYELGMLLDQDPAPLIKEIPNDSIAIYCNADKGYFYDVTLIKPKFKCFTHIVGISLDKYGHPTAGLKVLLTNDGLKYKDKYIKALVGSFKYGNNPSEIGIKIYKEKAKQWEEKRLRWEKYKNNIKTE